MSNFANTVRRFNPGGFWQLNDAVGSTTAADSGPNTNIGTLHGGITLGATGPIPGITAATFNGVDGYISVPSAASLNVGTGPFTAIAWFKSTVSPADHCPLIGTERSAEDTAAWELYMTAANAGTTPPRVAGGLAFDLTPDGYTTFVSQQWPHGYLDGLWHMVAVTVDRVNTPVIYVDGASVASQLDGGATSSTGAGMNANNGLATSLGASNDGANFLTGSEAGAALNVGTALTAGQIQALYNSAVRGWGMSGHNFMHGGGRGPVRMSATGIA